MDTWHTAPDCPTPAQGWSPPQPGTGPPRPPQHRDGPPPSRAAPHASASPPQMPREPLLSLPLTPAEPPEVCTPLARCGRPSWGLGGKQGPAREHPLQSWPERVLRPRAGPTGRVQRGPRHCHPHLVSPPLVSPALSPAGLCPDTATPAAGPCPGSDTQVSCNSSTKGTSHMLPTRGSPQRLHTCFQKKSPCVPTRKGTRVICMSLCARECEHMCVVCMDKYVCKCMSTHTCA